MSDVAWMIAGLYAMIALGVATGLAQSRTIKRVVPLPWTRWIACSWLGAIWVYEAARIVVNRLVNDD